MQDVSPAVESTQIKVVMWQLKLHRLELCEIDELHLINKA